jgi:hypothetical protein
MDNIYDIGTNLLRWRKVYTEAVDAATSPLVLNGTIIDGSGKRITNVAAPVVGSDVVNKVVLIDKVHLKDKDIKIILHPSRSVKATAKTTNDQIIFYYGGIKHLHKSYLLKYLTHELLHIIQPTQTVSKRYEKEIGKMQRGGIGGVRYHLEPAEFEVQLATLIAHIKRYYNDTKNSILNIQRSKFAWDTKRGEILNDLYNIGTTTKERFKGLIRNNLLPFI